MVYSAAERALQPFDLADNSLIVLRKRRGDSADLSHSKPSRKSITLRARARGLDCGDGAIRAQSLLFSDC